jgi:AcrR family transcriptional regulator/transposase
MQKDSHLYTRVKAAAKTTSARESGLGAQTREVILTVASNLFATHGYHGTTTREIAQGVGIRQPSLFHHFDSKAAIMQALLESDIGRTIADRERLARANESAASRLFRYILREVSHIATSPYNVAGIYSEEVRTTPELAVWYAKRRRLHRVIDRIVTDGQHAGEFSSDVSVDLVRAEILGTLERALTGYSGGQVAFDPRLADELATLLLRSILVDQERIHQLRETVYDSEVVSWIAKERDALPERSRRSVQETLVSDRSWAVIAGALPPRARTRGGQWRDDREVMETIAWRFVNGTSWRQLPPDLAPWQTAWKRHSRWVRDGTWVTMTKLARTDPVAALELAWMSSPDAMTDGSESGNQGQ